MHALVQPRRQELSLGQAFCPLLSIPDLSDILQGHALLQGLLANA